MKSSVPTELEGWEPEWDGEATVADLATDLFYILDHHPSFRNFPRVPLRFVISHELAQMMEGTAYWDLRNGHHTLVATGLAIVQGSEDYIEVTLGEGR